MSDLISRADAIEAVHKHFVDAFDNLPTEIDEDGDVIYKNTKSVNELLRHNKVISKALKTLPSADAVNVVRCKDCKYADPDEGNVHWVVCKIDNAPTFDDDFCSNGKRREKSEAEE